jgi:hypothetical protein
LYIRAACCHVCSPRPDVSMRQRGRGSELVAGCSHQSGSGRAVVSRLASAPTAASKAARGCAPRGVRSRSPVSTTRWLDGLRAVCARRRTPGSTSTCTPRCSAGSVGSRGGSTPPSSISLAAPIRRTRRTAPRPRCAHSSSRSRPPSDPRYGSTTRNQRSRRLSKRPPLPSARRSSSWPSRARRSAERRPARRACTSLADPAPAGANTGC